MNTRHPNNLTYECSLVGFPRVTCECPDRRSTVSRFLGDDSARLSSLTACITSVNPMNGTTYIPNCAMLELLLKIYEYDD